MAYCGPKGIPLSVFLSWSEDDQDAALQWQAHESQRCPQCGTHPDVWREDWNAMAPEPKRCRGCQLVAGKRRELSKVDGVGDGVHIHLTRRG